MNTEDAAELGRALDGDGSGWIDWRGFVRFCGGGGGERAPVAEVERWCDPFLAVRLHADSGTVAELP